MKLKTKFTLLVAGCMLMLLGSYYLLSIRSASHAFVEFNQKSVMLITNAMLEDDIVEASWQEIPKSLNINEQLAALAAKHNDQIFVLLDEQQHMVIQGKNSYAEFQYVPVDDGHQFKVILPGHSPFLVQYSRAQLTLNWQNKAYALFWLPRDSLDRKQQESLLMSRLADEFMVSLLVLSLLAAGLSWLGAWYFLRPLKRLKSGFTAIEQGQLDTQIAVKGKDEVADIVAGFNRLAAWLHALHQQYRQMNSDLSHELRTPINAIRSRIEAMEDGIVPMNAEQLSILSADLNSLNQLVDDLSLLSLTESKQLVLELSKISLSDLLDEIAARYQLQAVQAGIELQVNIQSNVIANIDALRVRQIVVNLLDNAFKYGAQGKVIALTLERSEQYTDIVVSDKGQGMNEQQQQAVFGRFYRAQQSRSDKNSLGLGLAICRQLAELMDAQLLLHSAPNKGATFTLRFSDIS
ncbi:sensor histidine kinase [Thalassotalea marina]|uniref:histidine kinase n=1 Tax=Thalassotalea marina TaxID=1673741 RepID=A0A919BMP1_9GAMM|nr:HAMP domain-containing sensor histidine kinase [Thalassotalea marina]GHF97879.1 hypothetical protein GCM10017161_27730 [Thalassotalea marina]